MVLCQQQFRRIAYLTQTVLPHFVNAQFGSAPETVLDAAQDAVHVMLVAFKLKHRVYDMLQYFRSCNAPFFVDMPDEDDGSARFFGKFQDGRRTLTHLYDAARRRVDVFSGNGLDGVDDHQVGRSVFDMGKDLFQRSLAGDKQITRFGMRNTVGTQFQLACAFLARHIQNLLV